MKAEDAQMESEMEPKMETEPEIIKQNWKNEQSNTDLWCGHSLFLAFLLSPIACFGQSFYLPNAIDLIRVRKLH